MRIVIPGNPYDRRLIPGGSFSGAAISVSDGGAVVAIGTDTGGSVRIPAGLCAERCLLIRRR